MGLFKDALKFPFKPFKRIWWFWISLIPVLGWVWFAGYVADINRHLIKDKKEDLPRMHKFMPTAKTGLIYLAISIILSIITTMLLWIPVIGWIFWIIAMLLIPIMLVHYSVTRKFKSGFDVVLASRMVFGHFWKYIVFNLCIIGISLIWAIASIPLITIPITFPAMSFSFVYLMARFYREVLEEHKKH